MAVDEPRGAPRSRPRSTCSALSSLTAAASFLAMLASPPLVSGFLMGVDFGTQFSKIAIVSPGKPFEIVHNQHSKRKTPTAVSFSEAVRSFGDDALMSASRGAAKTPMFFSQVLGRNLTGVEGGVQAALQLPKRYYPYSLDLNSSGSLRFQIDDEQSYTVEEIAAHVLSFFKVIAQKEADGIAPSETVITVSSQATLQERRAVLAAAEIAGCPRAQLVHATSAAALQRALDLDLGGTETTTEIEVNDTIDESLNGTDAADGQVNGTVNSTVNSTVNGTKSTKKITTTAPTKTSVVMWYNMGARNTEVCVVSYRGATNLGKSTVAMDMLGCGRSDKVGGHQIDLIIAEKMLGAFQKKYPKLADGIIESKRALKKLEKEANNLKHTLSANKDAQFRVESLYEDTDFAQPVSRNELEDWCGDVFGALSQPIEVALHNANMKLDDVDAIEMIGGGWRIPRVQSLVTEYLQSQRTEGLPVLNLSQHVNGDEAMATGAAFYGANSSSSFRTKKVFFTDFTPHSYSVVIAPLNLSQPHEDGWERGVELFPARSQLRALKTVKLHAAFDLRILLLENGNPAGVWELSGIHEAAMGTYAGLETPLVSLKIALDSSGIVQITSALAIFDEPVLPDPPAAANTSNISTNATAENENATTDADGTANAGSPESDASETVAPGAVDANAAEGGDATDEANSANATKLKPKIKKRKVTLTVEENFDGIIPRALSPAEKAAARTRLMDMNAGDEAVRKVDEAKNGLETFVYDSRGKLSDDENCLQVSTEVERAEISEMLTQTEEWLYEDEASSANFTVFEQKLSGLQARVVPIMKRAWELEQRPQLPEAVWQIQDYTKRALAFVKANMTWVTNESMESVGNLSVAFTAWFANVTKQQASRPLTEEPAYTTREVKVALDKLRSEAERLTKIKKIEPVVDPYGYGKYGGYGGYGGDDAKMRAFYENMYKNFSQNGSNASDWMKNFSNFSGRNDSDYMRSYYEHMARQWKTTSNYSDSANKEKSEAGSASGTDDASGAAGAGGEGAKTDASDSKPEL